MSTWVLLGQWCANMVGRQQRWLLSQVYLYGLTSLNRTRGQEKEWPWKMIWKPKVPYKVKCFTWFLEQQVVLTHENLNKRGHQLASRCYLCGEQDEPVKHLFLHCKWTEQLWRMFTSLKGIRWVKPGCIRGVPSSWIRDGNVTKEERWKIVPICIWWSIWNERNNRSFKNVQNSLQDVKKKCLALFYFWCKHSLLAQTEDIFDVLDCL